MRVDPAARDAAACLRVFAILSVAIAVSAGTAGIARAEGSAQLYPANTTCAPNSSGGSCRANIEWRTDAYGPASGAQVRRRSYMQVFAQAGEVLALGSSAVGVGAGDILVYDPGVVTDPTANPLPALTTGVNGFRCSDQRTTSGIAAQGRITSRAQELAGAQAVDGSGNLAGYVPCSYVAPVTGIYGVVFYGPDGAGSATDGGPTGQTGLASASNFDATQGSSIAAWDVTVRANASSTADITGRLFTTALIAFTGANGRPINVSVDVVTLDGFRYRTDTRGIDPNGFAFYGNQAGFLDGDGSSPLYHDAYGTTSSSELTGLAGGVTFAAPEYPIFFGPPAAATLAALGIPSTPVAPSLGALSFTGNVSGNTSSLGAGGTFSYTANEGGVYEIVISRDGVNFDPGLAQNRVLRGIGGAGTQSVSWDGKDNSGADFPVGANYAVRASLHAGEYHFPLIDAENSTLGGPTFTLLNPPGGVCPNASCTTAFFDDRGYHTGGPAATTVGTAPAPDTPLCGSGPPAAPYHSDPVAGYDSSGSLRAFGGDIGSNTNVPCTGSFGDVKGLDTWTYFPSTTSASSLDVVDSADVSLAKAHAGSFTVGQNGTFTLTVSNAGPGASGAITVSDALPSGLGFVAGSGAGWTCGAVGSNVTCTKAGGLASGGSSSITLTIAVGPAAAPSTTNAATVSAATFDSNTANNHSSDTAFVVPIPIAAADSVSTQQGAAVAIDVTGNDTLGVLPSGVTAHSAPAHGTVSCASQCMYTPDPSFAGLDSFDYTITDANGRTATASVSITVTPPASMPALAQADLAATVAGPSTAKPKQAIGFTATVRNNGAGTALATQVTLTLPAGLTVVPGSMTIDGAPAGDSCTATTSVITCRLGALANGDVVRLAWRATVAGSARSGSLVVRAAVGSATADPVPANNKAAGVLRVGVTAIGSPRLALVSTVDRKTVRPTGLFRVTIRVPNTGSTIAGRFLVCLPVPGQATFVAAPGAALRRGSACWSIAALDAASSRRFVVVLRVDATARPGLLRNVAVLTRARGRTLESHTAVRVLAARPRARPGGVTG